MVRHPLVARIVDAYERPTKPANPIAATLSNAAQKISSRCRLQYRRPARASALRRGPMRGAGSRLRCWRPAELTACASSTRDEGRALNRDYRGKDYATNVLTFAYTEDEDAEVTQADIILCADVLEREAA